MYMYIYIYMCVCVSMAPRRPHSPRPQDQTPPASSTASEW